MGLGFQFILPILNVDTDQTGGVQGFLIVLELVKVISTLATFY